MLCSASLLKRRAWWALNQPENAGRVGEGRGGAEGSPELPACGAGVREQRCVQLRQPLAGFSSWGCSLKAKFGRGVLQHSCRAGCCLSLAMRIWGFPSPRVSSQPRVSGWLHSRMAQLDVCRHCDSPTGWGKPPSLSALYLRCLSFASLQLFNTKGTATAQTLYTHPLPRWLERTVRQEPCRTAAPQR